VIPFNKIYWRRKSRRLPGALFFHKKGRGKKHFLSTEEIQSFGFLTPGVVQPAFAELGDFQATVLLLRSRFFLIMLVLFVLKLVFFVFKRGLFVLSVVLFVSRPILFVFRLVLFVSVVILFVLRSVFFV
jgi:hypothetical protein